MSLLLRKQRLGELLRVEGLEVVRLFAEADELDGQARLLLNRDDPAVLARAGRTKPAADAAVFGARWLVMGYIAMSF